MTIRSVAATCLIALACSGIAAAADNPFAGTWKMNQQKSRLAGDTMKFSAAEPGMIRYSNSAEAYTFKTDGTETTTPMGSVVSWTTVDPTTYTTTRKRNGTLLDTTEWKLLDGGKTLTLESKGTKPNGDTFDDKAVYSRTAAGPGLIGKWVSKQVNLSAPSTMDFKPTADGMSIYISAEKASVDAKLDGKDYPAKGPTVPDNLTLALTKTGALSMKMTEKLKGRPIGLIVYHVSSDGKTMIERGTNGQGGEPYSTVWEKQ